MIALADTGVLYALVDAGDLWHQRVIAWWEKSDHDVFVPVTVLPEVAYLLQSRIGPMAEERFIRAVADGEFEVEPLESEDVDRTAELMAAYIDMPLGFVDARVMAIAERTATRDILTTDRRHFSVVRPRHAKRFTILP